MLCSVLPKQLKKCCEAIVGYCKRVRGHQQLPGECLSSSPPASASRSCLVSHQHQQGASTSSPVQPVPSCLVFSVCWVSHYQPEGFKSLSTLCPCEAPWIHLASPAARPVQAVLRKFHPIQMIKFSKMELDLVSRLHHGELHHILKHIFLPLSPDQLAASRWDTDFQKLCVVLKH